MTDNPEFGTHGYGLALASAMRLAPPNLAREARLDAKAFRENTVYDSNGDPIRLEANALRLENYAACIEQLDAELGRLAIENLSSVPARPFPATSWQQQGDIEVLMMGDIPVGRLCQRGKPSWILNIASLSHSWTTEKTMEQARAALLAAFGDWCRKAGLA